MAAIDEILAQCQEFTETNFKPEDWVEHCPVERFWDVAIGHVLGGYIPPSRETIIAEENERQRQYQENRAHVESRVGGPLPHPALVANYDDRPVEDDRFDAGLMTESQRYLVIQAMHDLGEMAERYGNSLPHHYGVYSQERIAYEAMKEITPDVALLEMQHPVSEGFKDQYDPAFEALLKMASHTVSFWLVNVRGGLMDMTHKLCAPIFEAMELADQPGCLHCGEKVFSDGGTWVHCKSEVIQCATGGTVALGPEDGTVADLP